MAALAEGTIYSRLAPMNERLITPSKSELRRKLRLQRKQMTREQHSDLDRKINRALLTHVQALKISSVAAFWPFDGEPDLRPALKAMAALDITLALPVLKKDAGFGMSMHRWRPHSSMRENRFHIPEPVNEPILDLADIEVLVIPLVAWDSRGHRLGMGSGFYDRMLACLRGGNSPLRVGAAYSAQQVDEVPVDAWDVPLHAVVHEHGWISFG